MSDELKEIRIIGTTYPVVYVQTDLWSFDRSLGFRGEVGVPLRSIFELYGDEHIGKTTFAEHVVAKVRTDATVWIANLEDAVDKRYITDVFRNAGFTGIVRIADQKMTKKGKDVPRPHEAQVQDVLEALMEDEVSAGIVDSIGMFNPIVMTKKDLGERSMGQRAKTIGQASRDAVAILRNVEEPKLLIYINHVHPNIGSRGFSTPGGRTKEYAASIRVWMRRIENDVPEGSGNFLVETRCQKLKVGGAHPGRRGLVYFIPGYGVSKEMTDVFDCVRVKIAERGGVIRLLQYNDKKGEDEMLSMGRIGTIAEKAMEPHKHRAFFKKFEKALRRYEQDA